MWILSLGLQILQGEALLKVQPERSFCCRLLEPAGEERGDSAVIEEDSEDTVRLNAISLGEVAGLMYCAAKVSREV